ARITWLVLNTELLFIMGYLFSKAVPGIPRVLPMVFVPIFAFSVVSVLVGQVTALVLFSMAAAWRLLQLQSDRAAGWLLAWSWVKPQLSSVLLLATLVWLVRQRRWRAIEGFVAGGVVLLAVSLFLIPSWPLQIARSLAEKPMVTTVFPHVGTTWL